jgi:hypothetical protein
MHLDGHDSYHQPNVMKDEPPSGGHSRPSPAESSGARSQWVQAGGPRRASAPARLGPRGKAQHGHLAHSVQARQDSSLGGPGVYSQRR